MILTIDKESPFQVMNTAFTIGVSESGYTLQFSADGYEWADKMSVEANVVKVVQKVAGGAYWRLMGNTSKVIVNYYKERSSTPAPSPTPTPSVEDYLCMEAYTGDVTIYVRGSNNLEYSFDKNEWTVWQSGSDYAVTIPSDTTLYIKGENPKGIVYSTDNGVFVSSGEGKIRMFGKLQRLLGEELMDITDYTGTGIQYKWAFYGFNNLADASELIMPATVLTNNYCYDSLFESCSNLEKAPTLPAPSIGNGYDYTQLFQNCPKLTEIRAYFNGGSYISGMSDWVYNVASGGTFYGNNALTDEEKEYMINNYIPSGWTVIWEDVE